MKRFFIGLVATALLLLGVLFVAPGLVPSETYKARMEEQLSRMLGRDVALQGEVSLSTFPAIRARTGQATVANPPGFDREDMITLESLEARIRLLPLLSRRVEIAQFTLLEPDIYLARLPDGRANWDFASDGADAGAERDPAEPVEAFRRDGRFSAFQPSVDSLRIQDGRLSFQDAVSGRSHLLANIDVRIALPDMAQTLDIDGSLSADGTPVTVDLVLDNPRAFLDGREAPLKGSVEAAGVEARVDGTVAESPDMVFNGNVSGRLTDRARIEEWLPEPVSGLELVDEVNVSAAVSYDGSTGAARFEDVDMSASGNAFDMTYTGSARFVDGPELEGRYTATIRDAAAIAAVLSPDVTGLDAIGQTDVRGEVSLEADRLILRDTDLKTQSDALSGTLNGTFGRNGDRLTGNARFEADLADAGPTLRGFVPDLTRDADVLGAMSASGTLDLDGDRIAIDDLVTNTRSPLLTASYQGRLARTGSAVSLEGDASANVPSVTALNEALEAEIPYAESFGRVRLSASPEGEVGDLRLADLTVDMSEGAINGRFSGAAVLSETTSLSGAMEVDGPSLRAIAARNGTALPPATGDAPIFERFGLAGNVAGTLDELQLDDARLRLDALEAAGTFGINLRPERPLLTGDVRLGELDLRPYVSAYSAQRPEGALPPWSEASIPTQGLGAADARIEIAADGIRLPRIRLGQTRSTVTLENGRLEADVPQMDLYGGSGRGSFVLDGRSGEPAIAIEAGLRDLQAQSFLGAVAGFTRATGQGGTQVSLQGRGSSQAAIMRSLSGQGSFSVQDGSISGIDAAEFLNGLQSAFASRALPGGIGADKVTQFRELLGEFSMSQGVATIDDFTLDAATVAVEGSGQIDIGAQTIDIRFRPRARDRDMGGLAGFGIPLRLTGPFGAAQASLDADFLGQVLQARAAQEAQRVIGDRVGGTAGAVLGSILGAPQTVPDDPAEDGSEMPSADEAQPQDEPTIEDAVQDGLMELFGVRTREKGED